MAENPNFPSPRNTDEYTTCEGEETPAEVIIAVEPKQPVSQVISTDTEMRSDDLKESALSRLATFFHLHNLRRAFINATKFIIPFALLLIAALSLITLELGLEDLLSLITLFTIFTTIVIYFFDASFGRQLREHLDNQYRYVLILIALIFAVVVIWLFPSVQPIIRQHIIIPIQTSRAPLSTPEHNVAYIRIGNQPVDAKSGPDTDYPTIQTLLPNSIHEVIGWIINENVEDGQGWYQIRYTDGDKLWVAITINAKLQDGVSLAIIPTLMLTPTRIPSRESNTPYPSVTATFTPSPSNTPTLTSIWTASATPTPTLTLTPTATPTPTLTLTPTPPEGFCLINSPDGTDFIIHCESIRLERQPVATMAAYCQDLVNQEGASQYTWQMQSASHLQTASEYQASGFVIGDTFELVRESEGRYCTLRPGEFCTEELFDGSTTFPQRIPFRCVGTINMP